MSTLSKEVHDEMLDITEPHLFDESISSMNFYEYTPQTQANNNTSGHQISITINNEDMYTLPSESYISIKGQVRRADNNNAYAGTDHEITLINNAMMYLFTEIKYVLGSTSIETITWPGQVTSMIGYLSYPDDFSTSSGLSRCWCKDTSDNANSVKYVASAVAPAARYIPEENPNYNQGFAARKGYLFSSDPLGCFEFHIPLSHVFGFAEYKKVIYGMKHTLSLTRDSDNRALYRNAAATNGKVDITNISWYMPLAQLAPEYLAGMRTLVEQKATIPLAFRARTGERISLTQTQNFTWRLQVNGGVEKPRWIIIGFQRDREDTQQRNPAVFDHLSLRTAYVTLNSERYPMNNVNTNFDRNEYMKLYTMFDDFKKEYYGIDSLVGGTQVNVAAYKSLFPIIVFDVRKQNERLKSGVIDVKVNFEFSVPVPANCMAYSVMISDRFYKLASDGKNMSVVSL